VTPLSASTANQHIENQEQATASGVLVAAENTRLSGDGNGLQSAVLYWNESNGTFHGLLGGSYTNDGDFPRSGGTVEPTLANSLVQTFSERGIAFNVNIYYRTGDGEGRQRLVYRGEPSDNAVTASRVVTVYDTDPLYAANETRSATDVGNSTSFYAPDISSGSDIFNVFRVEVIVWRM
jgi:hypothetical protein